MKNNLMKYLREYGDCSFREMPFSEVDALVLALLVYMKFDGIVPGFNRGASMSWEDIKRKAGWEHLFSDPVYGSSYREAFSLIAGSRRFGRIRVNYFVEWIDEEREAQFAAITFFLGKSSVFVAFRGTDEHLVGWKEDFNMSYMRLVPSQKRALDYVKGVARYTSGRMIVGGHSKGGNLAVYSASFVPEAVQERIRRVYSFDGPGLWRHFYETPGFLRIRNRYCKIVPEQSVFGMMFSRYRDYRVVAGYKGGFVQHDLMQWKIRGSRFWYKKQLRKKSSRRSKSFDEWIRSLPAGQVALFVDTLYELIRSTRAGNVYELLQRPIVLARAVIKKFREMEKERRQQFWKILHGMCRAISSGKARQSAGRKGNGEINKR